MTITTSSEATGSTNTTRQQNIRVIPFAVALPPELLGPRALDVSGIVGTITLLGDKSAMVWFGLGQVQPGDESNHQVKETIVVGTALHRPMGPLLLAMPRSHYQGAFGSHTPTTKLIGHDQEDIELLVGKMAARLTQRIPKAVFVSCDLEAGITNGSANQILQQRVAALAEQEVYRILVQGHSYS